MRIRYHRVIRRRWRKPHVVAVVGAGRIIFDPAGISPSPNGGFLAGRWPEVTAQEAEVIEKGIVDHARAAAARINSRTPRRWQIDLA